MASKGEGERGVGLGAGAWGERKKCAHERMRALRWGGICCSGEKGKITPKQHLCDCTVGFFVANKMKVCVLLHLYGMYVCAVVRLYMDKDLHVWCVPMCFRKENAQGGSKGLTVYHCIWFNEWWSYIHYSEVQWIINNTWWISNTHLYLKSRSCDYACVHFLTSEKHVCILITHFTLVFCLYRLRKCKTRSCRISYCS